MKTLLMLALLSPASAFASQLGCSTSVAISVRLFLNDQGKKGLEILAPISVESDVADMLKFIVPVVRSAESDTGIPYSAEYVVYATPGPMNTCSVGDGNISLSSENH